MNPHVLLPFALTVLPLICTPGPDMLYIASQAISGRALAGLGATAGVCAGYVVHSLLVAFGLAALIAASPLLFSALRWLGVAYLAYLALQLLRSAARSGRVQVRGEAAPSPFRRGLVTALLNPKGMLISFAILPQFMPHDAPPAPQAIVLSAVFIGLCALVYSVLSVVLAAARTPGGLSDHRRRCVEGASGGLLALAAARLASN